MNTSQTKMNTKIINNLLQNWTLNIDQIRDYSDFKGHFIELIDKDLCQLVVQMKSDEWTFDNVSPVLTEFNDYIAKIKMGQNHHFKRVQYYQSNKNLLQLGRFYGDSIINKPKLIKHTLFKQSGYVDIDQVKGHPTILLEIIKLNGQLESFPCLNAYIHNPQQQFVEMSEYYGTQLSNDQKKWFFNMVIYGGSWKSWYSRLTQPNFHNDTCRGYQAIELNNNLPRPFEVGFINECKKLIDIIFKNNEQLHIYLMNHHNTYKDKNQYEQKNE